MFFGDLRLELKIYCGGGILVGDKVGSGEGLRFYVGVFAGVRVFRRFSISSF